ncbi:unnamed protein product [Chondrus crispus]|uniref:Uncharacterized protein n=1 Tax=Chondrus crispus TaxID=2769 RepID=R7QGE9_CHOCR|nr:unnamed protein product [Chondrus crispus]CDF36511.1 unnamed protein product [Chondrus crispus]|eukprot:XP_005716330.1 unnamed protein product [Chondrus crispus]
MQAWAGVKCERLLDDCRIDKRWLDRLAWPQKT